MLDEALNLMNTYGRIIACGGISQYNAADSSEIYGLKNYMAIVRSQLLYQGFIVSRWADEFDEARAQLAAWLAEGKLAHEETIMGECLPAAADPVALPPLLIAWLWFALSVQRGSSRFRLRSRRFSRAGTPARCLFKRGYD